MSWNNKEEIETTCSTVQQWRWRFPKCWTSVPNVHTWLH